MMWGEGRKRSTSGTFGALTLFTATMLAVATAAPAVAYAGESAPTRVIETTDGETLLGELLATAMPLIAPLTGAAAFAGVRPFDASEADGQVADAPPESTPATPAPVETVPDPAPEPQPAPATTPEPTPAADPVTDSAPPVEQPAPVTPVTPVAAPQLPAPASAPAPAPAVVVTTVDGGDVRFVLGAGDDHAILRDVGGRLQLSSANSSFATIDFNAPGLFGQVLRLEGGGGRDSLVVLGIIDLMNAAFEALFESITFAGADVTASSVTATAVAEATEGRPEDAPDCAEFDHAPAAECMRHDAVAAVIVDGGSITAGHVELRAQADVRPAAASRPENIVLIDAAAIVDVRGGARIDAAEDLVISANAVVGPLDLTGQSLAVLVRSNASATVTDAVVAVLRSASISANSTVALSASSSSPSSGAAQAAGSGVTIALLSVTASAAARITGGTQTTVGSALAVTAANNAVLSAAADATRSASTTGVAAVHLEQTTDAAIDSTAQNGVTAASVDLLAAQHATVTASAFSNGGGGDTPADATAQADTTSTTTARIDGAHVNTTGTVTVRAEAANSMAVGADSGSGGSATAVLTADLDTRAYVRDAVIEAGGGTAFEAQSATRTSAWAVGSGRTTVIEDVETGGAADTAVSDAGEAAEVDDAFTLASKTGRGASVGPRAAAAVPAASVAPEQPAAPIHERDDSPYPPATPLPELALVGVGTSGATPAAKGLEKAPARTSGTAPGSAAIVILATLARAMYGIYAGISTLSEPTRGPPTAVAAVPFVDVLAVVPATACSGPGSAPLFASSSSVPVLRTAPSWSGAAADACAGGFSRAGETRLLDVAAFARICAITVRVSAGDGALDPASGSHAFDAVEPATSGAGIQGPESCGVRRPLNAAAGPVQSSGPLLACRDLQAQTAVRDRGAGLPVLACRDLQVGAAVCDRGAAQTALHIEAAGGGGWAGGSGATPTRHREADDTTTV